MNNEFNLKRLEEIINQSGLKFERSNDIITTFWRLENHFLLKIITFLDDSKSWIINTAFIANIKDIKKRDELILEFLKRNRLIIGTKISIDENFNIYCGFDVHKSELNPESLKMRFIQQANFALKLKNLIEN